MRSTGSSPRTWGTVRPRPLDTPLGRFIPTYVGNRLFLESNYSPLSVHPHVRGEQCTSDGYSPTSSGSSPRTWGTAGWPRAINANQRFIPTYVGNSEGCLTTRLEVAVHPHVRGEQEAGAFVNRIGLRFIPTYVGNRACSATGVRGDTVHPHVRGEQFFSFKICGCDNGSSPRTWGTGIQSDNAFAKWRFIPTYVGNRHSVKDRRRAEPVHPHVRGEQMELCYRTRPGVRFIPTYVGNRPLEKEISFLSTVHPHVRGEQGYPQRSNQTVTGSSPRTWGTGGDETGRRWWCRFIPTYVGNRRRALLCLLRSAGSSPRTWGTVDQALTSVLIARFIPTYVGNSARRALPRASKPVHPHVRGEQPGGARSDSPGRGSSPRTWGTAQYSAMLALLERFIPTYVGNSSRRRNRTHKPAVHPHVRGEQRAVKWERTKYCGSSPRTWGTGCFSRMGGTCRRFIPTYVGNSFVQNSRFPSSAVHPHVRGEQSFMRETVDSETGSSPRTWGTDVSRCQRDIAFRFIPTYVGNRTRSTIEM